MLLLCCQQRGSDPSWGHAAQILHNNMSCTPARWDLVLAEQMLSDCACGRASRGARSCRYGRSCGKTRALGPRRRGGGGECAGGCGAALRAAANWCGSISAPPVTSKKFSIMPVAYMCNDVSLPCPGGCMQCRLPNKHYMPVIVGTAANPHRCTKTAPAPRCCTHVACMSSSADKWTEQGSVGPAAHLRQCAASGALGHLPRAAAPYVKTPSLMATHSSDT